ncbi:MAG: hypothetical protein NC124_06790 [Clostridium sp.]|nr:hypothetical protein [Clostridium sp.]
MNNYSEIMLKSEDIYQLISKLTSIGWKSIRESSINRIIYLSAVLYSFRYPDDNNIFEDDYKFSVTLSGPEDAEVEKALINLESNEVLEHTELGYALCLENKISLTTSQAERKKEWFDDIAYVIGIYGEDKIFDFIYRDPEYRESLDGNSTYNLNLGKDNATVEFLNSFKDAFEEKIVDKRIVLENKKYLELYFEYVFGKILRGER